MAVSDFGGGMGESLTLVNLEALHKSWSYGIKGRANVRVRNMESDIARNWNRVAEDWSL